MKWTAPVFLLFLFAECHLYAKEWVEVESVTDDIIEYRRYVGQETDTITFSELIIHDHASDRGSVIYRHLYPDLEAVQAALLRNGLARLKEPDAASGALRALEREARAAGVGLWAEEGEAPTSDDPASTTDWSEVIRVIFTWIVSLGLVGLLLTLGWRLVRRLYRWWYIERNVELLIIGRASAGKTAIRERLIDPSVTTERIAHLTPTAHAATAKRDKHITMGKYEVYPVVTDVPGAKPGAFLDHVIGNRIQILLTVLAPTQLLTKHDPDNKPDDSFIHSQLGYVEALVEGTLQSRRIGNPRLIIILLNKFDLWSLYPPFDSAAAKAREEFERIFADHTSGIKRQAKQVGVGVHTVVGSALRGWGTDQIMKIIEEALYGK